MAKKTTVNKINRALDRLAREINRGKVDVAVISGAEQMLEIVKSQAPVRRGKLRDSLYIDRSGRGESRQYGGWKDMDKYSTASRTSVWGAPGKRGHLAMENVYCKIATDLYYAWFVEYGTQNMAPQPFMRPAFDSAARPIADSIFSAVQTLADTALASI